MDITLYTKQNCHLCDALKFELLDLQEEYDFSFQERFVEDDPALRELAGSVPLVDLTTADGQRERLTAPIRQADLRQHIHAQMAQAADQQ